MPDQFGGNTRFKSSTNIDHSRTREPASGIPRSPGRPQNSQDAMPRNRGDSPQKTGVPGWAKALLKPQAPGWATQEGARQQQQPQQTGFGRPYDTQPVGSPQRQPQRQAFSTPVQPQPQRQDFSTPAQPQRQPQGQPQGGPARPSTQMDQLALRKRLAMMAASRRGRR